MFRAFSRLVQVAKSSRLTSKDVFTSSKRTSATRKWYYRTAKPDSDIPLESKIRANIIGTLMWYVVLWHMWYDSARLLGHHPVVDPLSWTDEELGIPSTDYD